MNLNIKRTFRELADDKHFVQDMKELISNQVFLEDTNNFFTIVPNIKGQQQIAGIHGVQDFTAEVDGCLPNCKSPVFANWSQFWNPKKAGICIKWCYKDFEGAFTQWGLANGYSRRKLDESDFFVFLIEKISEGMKADLLKIILFGDKDIQTGILTDPNMAPMFKIIDKGLIPTLQALKADPDFIKEVDNIDDYFIPIPLNEAQPGKQFEFDEKTAKNIYEQLVDTTLFTGNMLLTSSKLYRNYESFFKNYYLIQSSKDEVQKGIRSLAVDGQNLTPLRGFDYWNKRYFSKEVSFDHDNDAQTADKKGIKQHIPHFALYTDKENLQIGVDSEEALTDLEFEYVGGNDENFYIKASYLVDFKIPNPFKLKAAF